jgi:hypothetical protein
LFADPIKWIELPILNPPPSEAKSIITKSPTATSSNAKTADSQQPSSPNKTIIVGISVGSVVVVLSLLVVFSLAYRRIKKRKSQTNIKDSGHLDSPSAFQIKPDYYQQYFQQQYQIY